MDPRVPFGGPSNFSSFFISDTLVSGPFTSANAAPVTVPEPSVPAMLVLGLAVLLVTKRRNGSVAGFAPPRARVLV
jgi:hypothetical protein